MPTPSPRFTVLRDTAEKPGHGWSFPPSADCEGTMPCNLFTGDYSLAGFYEDRRFVIERKGSVSELCGNLTQKEKWDDFKQELERLEEFALPFLILEFTMDQVLTYPRNSGIPPRLWPKIRVKPEFLLKRILEISLHYRTKILFAGGHGHEVACSLFRRVVGRG